MKWLGVLVGLILTVYGLYLFVTVRAVVGIFSQVNANLPQCPYLVPFVVIVAGVLLVVISLFSIKRPS